jgi:hypothetical protein
VLGRSEQAGKYNVVQNRKQLDGYDSWASRRSRSDIKMRTSI